MSTFQPVRHACLFVFLVVSALAVAAAGTLPSYRWLGWVALVPVFVAIRVCGPFGAFAAGAAWGGAYYGLATIVFGVPFRDGLSTPIFVILAPALYCASGASVTRRIGFSPFVLGVGWMGVEAALAPLDANALAAPAAATPLLHSLARGLGYVLVASLVGYVNALLVSTVVRLAQNGGTTAVRRSACEPRARLQPAAISLAMPAFALRALLPRAPPPRVSAAT